MERIEIKEQKLLVAHTSTTLQNVSRGGVSRRRPYWYMYTWSYEQLPILPSFSRPIFVQENVQCKMHIFHVSYALQSIIHSEFVTGIRISWLRTMNHIKLKWHRLCKCVFLWHVIEGSALSAFFRWLLGCIMHISPLHLRAREGWLWQCSHEIHHLPT